MTKKIICLLGILIPVVLYAQITISTQFPPGGLVPKDHLWNIILSNSKEEITDLSIKMNLQDAFSGEILMSANTGSFVLGKGVKIITSRDLPAIQYNYAAQDFSKNYLPMGAYIVCYQAYSQKDGQVLGEECININIDPLSPPLLTSPADKAVVETPYPQFTWMPPTATDLFNNLTYEILVTEMLEGQAPAEAIQYNSPLYWKNDIPRNNDNYPSSYSALENGKTYAWQVIARNGRSYAAKTEVWTFTFNKDKMPEKPASGMYILLTEEFSGVHIIQNRQLHIKLHSFNKEQNARIVFTNSAGKKIKEAKHKMVHGDNYFDFDLGRNFKDDETYNVTIYSNNTAPYILKFSLK